MYFNDREILHSLYGASIEENVNVISREGFMGNIKDYLENSLPNFRDTLKGLKEYLSNLVSNNSSDFKPLIREQTNILKSLKDISYIEVSEVLVPIPENFKGDFLSYLKDLDPIIHETMSSCLGIIKEYRTYISLFLSTKDTKQRMTDMTPKFKELAALREQCIAKLNLYFPKDTSSTRTMLKNVVARMNDFNEIYSTCDKITNYLNFSTIEKLRSEVNDCYSVLSVITEDIKSPDSNVSREAAANLSVGTYEIARYVELVSTLYFDAIVAIKSATNIGQMLVETVK